METSWQCFKKNNNQIATYIQLFLRNCSCESVILYKIEKPNRKTHLKTCLAIVFSFEVSDDPEFTLMHDYWNVCYSPQSLLSMKRQTVLGALWALLCMCLKKKKREGKWEKKTIELAMKRGTNLKILKWYVVSNHFGQGRHNANDNQ